MRPQTLLTVSFALASLSFLASGSQSAPAGEPAVEEAKEGFVPIFNGKDLSGWVGIGDDTSSYYVKDGLLICKATGHVHIFSETEYDNFVLRLQIKLDPGGNNGVGIRTRISPNPHIEGMELQVLDDDYYKDGKPITLKDYQHHGSIYGVVPAKTGHLKPAGQWNDEEVLCDGRHVRVTLNGTVIVDADLDKVKPIDGQEHPGLQYVKGRIGLHAHGNYGAEVAFRNLQIKSLKAADPTPKARPTSTLRFCGAAAPAAKAGETPAPQVASERALKVGFAERDISPAIGMECPGGYGKAFHRQLHDPCKARAVVFDDGKTRVALVGVDALIVRRELVEAVRKEIQQKCGIGPEAVLVGASHSHTSGPTGMILPGEFDKAPPLTRTLAYEKSSCADAKYLALVHKGIVGAVCEADGKRAAAQCGVGSGTEEKVSFNRRFHMKSGLCHTHPGKGNPDIVGPAGPIDPRVGVIGAWDSTGKLLGCVVNFACHATTGTPGSSANWIYWMEKTIRGTFGPDVVVVFLQGASGDVTQVNNLSLAPDPDGPTVGGRVGAEAVKVLLSMTRGALGPVDAKTTSLTVKRRIPRPERVAKCRDMVQKDPGEVGHTAWTFAKEIVLLDYLASREPAARFEVQAVQVGPAVFLANPAEFFCQLGLDLKAGSPFKYTFPVELANDCIGYVPTAEALGPEGGGYETRLTAYSNLEPTAGRQIVEAAVGVAQQMKPGEPPIPAKSAPWSSPWEYGNVPPEVE